MTGDVGCTTRNVGCTIMHILLACSPLSENLMLPVNHLCTLLHWKSFKWIKLMSHLSRTSGKFILYQQVQWSSSSPEGCSAWACKVSGVTGHCCSAGFGSDPCGVFSCCWSGEEGCKEGSTSVSEAKPVPVNSLALFNPAPWFLSCEWKDPGLGLLDKHPKHHQSLHQSANSYYPFFPPKFFPFPSLILIQKNQLSPNHFFPQFVLILECLPVLPR